MIGSITNLFPLSIYQVKGGISEKVRNNVVNDIDVCIKDAGPSKSTSTWTGDCNGYHAIHNSKVYAPIFKMFGIAVRDYIAALGSSPDMYDYYYTRSWGVRQTKAMALPAHTHAVSHLSGVYYPKVPEGSGSFIASNPDPANQLFSGMYDEDYYLDGTLDPNNPLCAQEASFKVYEDLLLLFPSKTMHRTIPNASDEARYSITTDILLILKDAARKEGGMNPVQEWIKA